MKRNSLAVAAALCLLSVPVNAARLSLSRIGEGVINPGVGVHSYSLGRQVTITATPAPGWVVDHWEGDITGTGSAKTVQLLGDRRATVVFQPQVATPANALVRYVGEQDNNYRWSLHDVDRHFGWSKHTIRMQSQQWRSSGAAPRKWTAPCGSMTWVSSSHGLRTTTARC